MTLKFVQETEELQARVEYNRKASQQSYVVKT